MGRRTKLTPEVQEVIVRAIRKGAFDWVAAEAAGIGRRTFYRWLSSGEARSDSLYRQFWHDVRQARAEARQAAEARVFKDNAFNWLRYGPGRERPGAPGWTERMEHAGEGGGPVTIRVITAVPRPVKEEE